MSPRAAAASPFNLILLTPSKSSTTIPTARLRPLSHPRRPCVRRRTLHCYRASSLSYTLTYFLKLFPVTPSFRPFRDAPYLRRTLASATATTCAPATSVSFPVLFKPCASTCSLLRRICLRNLIDYPWDPNCIPTHTLRSMLRTRSTLVVQCTGSYPRV